MIERVEPSNTDLYICSVHFNPIDDIVFTPVFILKHENSFGKSEWGKTT